MRNTQRLDKVLANLGYGTRTEVKKLIKDGAVKVNDITATDPGIHVEPENDKISISGLSLDYKEYLYIMMNKPAGVISATFDPRHRTALDLLPEKLQKQRLFPAGRLDIDTEGLLLLTNDGDLAHELLSPKKHVTKRYYALVEGMVNEDDIHEFKKGVTLDDGYKTLPADLAIIRQGTHSEIELVIYEGKFHQVKRMFEAAGKKVKYLKRLSMGALEMDETLRPGEFRELKSEELELLKRKNNGKLV